MSRSILINVSRLLPCLILSGAAIAQSQAEAMQIAQNAMQTGNNFVASAQQQQQAPSAQQLQQGAQQLLTPVQPPTPHPQATGGDGLPATPEVIAPPRPIEPGDRIVELAICLDTSGSMEGLINAARVKLWEIVNDLALAKPTPRLRVALLTYGNDGHNAENGWVNIDIAFTEDLDMVSQQLFALTTNGGTELVGRVLKAAGEKLDWNASDDVLKLIVVAGNESAEQDTTFNFRDVCKSTISRGVMVNSIYCGNIADDIAPAWKEVSTLADGHFASIDQNNGTITIATPFDDELVTLSATMNTTYIAYGAQGEWAAGNQAAQDANASGAGKAVAAQRAVTKGGAMYCNAQWDLVDACNAANVKIEDVKVEDLPENMRSMTMDERKAYVADMTSKRAAIQKQVADLNAKRSAYVEAEMRKMASAGDKSFDAAIRGAIRAQAASKGFTFEEPKPVASN